MSLQLFAAAIFGAGIGYTLLVMVAGWRGGSLFPQPDTSTRARRRFGVAEARRAALAAGVGVVAVLLTRYPSAGVAGAAVVWLWPRIFGASSAGARALARLEAIATWTESLRDTCKGGSGLEQAIPATVHAAPASIRPHLMRMAGALAVRVDMATALRRFARDVNDAGCDLVVAGLLLNTQLRGPRLGELLGSLAAATRDELEMRQKVETQRRSLRRQNRIIVVVILGFVTVQLIVADQWTEAYESVFGQAVLTGFLGVWLAAFMWMRSLAEPQRTERLLDDEEVVRVGSL